MATRPRFNLKNKKEKNTLISLIYRVNGKRIVFSTGLTIAPKNWNDKAMRARVTADFVDAQVINDQLNRIEEYVKVIDREFRTEEEPPSAEQFKKALNQKLQGVIKSPKNSFTAFIETFIIERAEMPNYSLASIKVYKTARNHYSKFTKGKTIDFKDVTLEHLNQFVSFLRRNDLGDNTVHKIMATLRAIFYEASKRGLHQNPKFSISDTKVTRRDSDTVYLNIDELIRIKNLDLSKNVRLSKVRDLFLIGAFTGLRFSDFTNITSSNIRKVDHKEILTITTQKTQDRLEIPLHPIVKTILNSNGGLPPKLISIQKLNTYLKEICQILGMNELVTIREYPAGKMKVSQVPKWELVSSHTARRSFATNAYKAGIDAISIMKITGHKQHTTFMKYIRVDKEENAVRMAGHAFFQ
jgi:site-specific recombinase XerD